MKAQVVRRKLPSLGCCGLLVCGFLLAQEWRFAVWLLGTVGQCSQSSVCSLACRAPRVSLAPEGRQTKRHHCLTHWSRSPTHSSLLLNGGTFLFLGEEWQKETSFLETGPQDNKTAVVLSYVFFLSLNAILSCCLWWYVFFFWLCVFHLLLSSLDSELFVLCCCINIFWVKPRESAKSNRHISHDIQIPSAVTNFSDYIQYMPLKLEL